MKSKFKYKFSKPITILIFAGMAVSVLAFGLNIYFLVAGNAITTAANSAYPIIQYTLMFFVAIALFVILLSLLISSDYVIDEKYLRSNFGIIRSKYELEKITSAVLDQNTKKLAVYFDEETYIVIVIKQDWYENFIDTLLKANPKIEYSVISKESNADKDDKKDK